MVTAIIDVFSNLDPDPEPAEGGTGRDPRHHRLTFGSTEIAQLIYTGALVDLSSLKSWRE